MICRVVHGNVSCFYFQTRPRALMATLDKKKQKNDSPRMQVSTKELPAGTHRSQRGERDYTRVVSTSFPPSNE